MVDSCPEAILSCSDSFLESGLKFKNRSTGLAETAKQTMTVQDRQTPEIVKKTIRNRLGNTAPKG